MRTLKVEGDFMTNLWEMTATAAGNQTLNLDLLSNQKYPWDNLISPPLTRVTKTSLPRLDRWLKKRLSF
jgi:hypothetical protein